MNGLEGWMDVNQWMPRNLEKVRKKDKPSTHISIAIICIILVPRVKLDSKRLYVPK